MPVDSDSLAAIKLFESGSTQSQAQDSDVDPLAEARQGSVAALAVLGYVWPASPSSEKRVEALKIFLQHLKQDTVPTTTSVPTDRATGITVNRAFQCLSALGGAYARFEGSTQPFAPLLLDAWPSIHAWSVYLFNTRGQDTRNRNPKLKYSTVSELSTAWNTLATHEPVRSAMLDTPQTLEIATHLWMEEDPAKITDMTDPPFGTSLIYSLLEDVTLDSLDRVLRAVDNQPLRVAELALHNVKTALSVGRGLNGDDFDMHVGLMTRLSAFHDHPFRHALLSKGVITTVTSALIELGKLVNDSTTRTSMLGLDNAVSACFIYLSSYVESTDGFTWVAQAVRAGLLQAFCDCSPIFNDILPSVRDAILNILKKTLPQYMVYHSVLQCVDAAMKSIERESPPLRIRRLAGSVPAAKQTWNDFRRLTVQRVALAFQVLTDFDGLVCDNIKCQKVGSKENMRACAACSHTYYCSKECQTMAWKHGDHKTVCKVKQQQRIEGLSSSMTPKDSRFLHHLTLREGANHLPQLRDLVKQTYPNVPLYDIVVKVDYTVTPPVYSLGLLDDTPTGAECLLTDSDTGAGAGASASDSTPRADIVMIENVKQAREKHIIFESRVASGKRKICLVVAGAACMWEYEPDPEVFEFVVIDKRGEQM